MAFITAIDHRILLWMQESLRSSFLTGVLRVFTHLGDGGFLWICLTLLLLFPEKTRKTGFLCAGGLLGSLFMNNTLLKPLVHRARPFDAWTDLTALVARPGGSSFPSGHTGAAFAFAWTFFRTQPKQLGIPVLFAAALMGFSRLYVGVHYPTDVLAGALVGIGVGEVMVQLGKRKRKDEEITA